MRPATAAPAAMALALLLAGCGYSAVTRYLSVEGHVIWSARAMTLERPGHVLVGFRDSHVDDLVRPHVDRVRLADGKVLDEIGPFDAPVLRIRMVPDGRALVLTETSLSWIVHNQIVPRCTLPIRISDILFVDDQLLASGAGLFTLAGEAGTCQAQPLLIPVEGDWKFHGLLRRGPRVLAISDRASKLVDFDPAATERPTVLFSFERTEPGTPIAPDSAVLADGRLLIPGGPASYLRVVSLERSAVDLDVSVGPRPRAPVLDGDTWYVLTDRGIAELRLRIPPP